MTCARGSAAPGRWWSVINTGIPSARAASTPPMLDTPLSTVTMSVGRRLAASATISGVSP